jgi:hypothetical protein
MKKLLATILTLLYLSTTMGATLHLHYCMGKLISWGFTDSDSKNCTFCGMPKVSKDEHCMAMKKDCCKDEHRKFKVDKDQKTTKPAFKSFDLPVFTLAGQIAKLPDHDPSPAIVGHPDANAPPGDPGPLFLRNRSFRI